MFLSKMRLILYCSKQLFVYLVWPKIQVLFKNFNEIGRVGYAKDYIDTHVVSMSIYSLWFCAILESTKKQHTDKDFFKSFFRAQRISKQIFSLKIQHRFVTFKRLINITNRFRNVKVILLFSYE